jgi:hypothetical protein
LVTGGAFDFSGATITGIEAALLLNTGVTATFSDSQLRAGAIALVAGNGASHASSCREWQQCRSVGRDVLRLGWRRSALPIP